MQTKPNEQMSWKKSKHLLLLVTVSLSSVAFSLDKVPEEEPDKVIRYGVLVVGKQTQKGSKETESEAAADTDGHQADQPEATMELRLAELRLQRLRPSVRCDNDSMTLRIEGRRVPHFWVERGEESPVQLSDMPAHCGISVRRARREVYLLAKYDGCHITQQGDRYILPLRLWGAPVKMSCPTSTPLTVFCTPSAMVIQFGFSTDAIKLKVSGAWQPLVQVYSTCGFTLEAVAHSWIVTAPYTSSCFRIEDAQMLLSVLYMNGELTLSCPVVPPPATTPSPADKLSPVSPAPQAPIDHPFPHGYAVPGFWPFHHGFPMAPLKSPTVAPKSTSPTSTASSTSTTSTTASSTSTKASADQQLWYPFPYGYGRYWPFYHSPLGTPPNNPTATPKTTGPTTTTTTTSSTSTKANADQQPWYPYPYGYGRYWPFYHSPLGNPPNNPTTTPKTTGPTTTTTTSTSTKASADQQQWYPYPYGYGRYWPFYHSPPVTPPNNPTATPKTTGPTTTTSSTPTKANADQQLWYPYAYNNGRHWHFFHGYPPAPTKSPTVAPTTTGPPTTASTSTKANAEEQLWYPYPYGYAIPRPWLFYPGHPGVPPKSPTVAPKTTGPTTTATTPTKANADQLWYLYPYGSAGPLNSGYPGAPTKSPTVTPTTLVTTVKPPSADRQLSHRFPWLPVAYNPMLSQRLPVLAPASGFRQPVHPHSKHSYPMYQMPYALQQNPAPLLVSPAKATRRHRPQLYSWPMYYSPPAYSPPRQPSMDTGTHPFMPRSAYDQAFASKGKHKGKPVTHPASLSPLQVQVGPTNRDGASPPTENTPTTTS